MAHEQLRRLPSVDQLLQTPSCAGLIAAYGRTSTVIAIREVLAEVREQIQHQTQSGADVDGAGHVAKSGWAAENFVQQTADRLETWMKPSLEPVINATGVILHTNLGRAPLSAAAIQAVHMAAAQYTNLEFDLDSGKRGSRLIHAEDLLCRLTGAEAALVVNNNAAALLLALTALARRQRVVVSRTQLIEIGGGFRIPDVMSQSGAKLVEVGATNRVHLTDFVAALQTPTALVVRAHHSNFRIIGFTAEPTLAELVETAHAHHTLLLDDLGSGVLLDTARYGLSHEPTVQESLAAGADLICFSGDKLLGGPQAGILIGQRGLITRLKKHPLARALRADKLCLAALSATLLHYLKEEAEREIPVWQMIARTPAQLQATAAGWAEHLAVGEVVSGVSTVGGGSLPEETLPTFLLALTVARPDAFLAALRRASPPVIARVEHDRVMLDPRTVFAVQEDHLLKTIRDTFDHSSRGRRRNHET